MRLFFTICLYLFSTAAFAKRLAVLDFTSTKAEADVLSVMAEMVRNTAANQLAPSGVKVMDKANMLSLLEDQGKDASCISGQCEIDLGRNIGADYVVMGQLTVLDADWILNLSLYDTASGSKLKGQTIEKPSSKALRRALNDETRLLLSALKKRSSQMDSIQEGFGTQDDEDDWNPGGENLVAVQFASEPSGATVLVDGEEVCETPCSQPIAEGAHQVLFTKKRHRSETRDLLAKTGARLSVRLKPKFGWFSVTSNPVGVEVFLDGKAIGKTPINKREVDPGVHKIKVNDPCFKPLDYRFQSKIGVHKSDIPTLPLKARQSAIQVTAFSGKDAVAGEVFVDGKKVGSAGKVIKVPLCSKTGEVRTQKGQRWSQKLSLKEKTLSKITAKLNEAAGQVYKSKLGVNMVYFPPGDFYFYPKGMAHITHGFYMMNSEVTRGLYKKIMANRYVSTGSADRPIADVSWFDMVLFANALSKSEGLELCYQIKYDSIKHIESVAWPKGFKCKGWRLPTEDEWQYAAKSGGSGFNHLTPDRSWYRKNSDNRTHPVCKKEKNRYGLCDMSGNVWEWVWTNLDRRYDYSRVIRGGGYFTEKNSNRHLYRQERGTNFRRGDVGARLLRSAETEAEPEPEPEPEPESSSLAKDNFPAFVQSFHNMNETKQKIIAEAFLETVLSGEGKIIYVSKCGFWDASKAYGSDCYVVIITKGAARLRLYFSQKERGQIDRLKKGKSFTFRNCKGIDIRRWWFWSTARCDMPEASL